MIYQLVIGLDESTTEHHATALLSVGTIVHNKPLPPSEPTLSELIEQHGPALMVVD